MRATTDRVVALSPLELLACWEALDLGEPPYQLRLRRPSGPYAAQRQTRQVLANAMVGLAARRLSDGAQPDPELADMLRLLAHRTYQLDIRFTGSAGTPRIGLGPITDTSALMVTTTDDGISPIVLRALDRSKISGALLGLVGPITAGIAPPVNIPGETFDQACQAAADGGMWQLADALTARGVPRTEAAALVRMTTDITFAGQLGVTAWHEGRERRGPWVVGFVRNKTGGMFLQVRRAGTVTMCPTDARRLGDQWQSLINCVLH